LKGARKGDKKPADWHPSLDEMLKFVLEALTKPRFFRDIARRQCESR
jgi:hypothetical protein